MKLSLQLRALGNKYLRKYPKSGNYGLFGRHTHQKQAEMLKNTPENDREAFTHLIDTLKTLPNTGMLFANIMEIISYYPVIESLHKVTETKKNHSAFPEGTYGREIVINKNDYAFSPSGVAKILENIPKCDLAPSP